MTHDIALAPSRNPAHSALPAIPALACGPGGAVLLTAAGEFQEGADKASQAFKSGHVLLCHAGLAARHLELKPAPSAFDLLELYVFVRPADPCAPALSGVCRKLGMNDPGRNLEDQAMTLPRAAQTLLSELGGLAPEKSRDLIPLAAVMGRKGGWAWAGPVLRAMGQDPETAFAEYGQDPRRALGIWERLRNWHAPEEWSASPAEPLTDPEIDARLEALIHALPGVSEPRSEQLDYARGMGRVFSDTGESRTAALEAGTGVGKTLGYLAPASLWAEKKNSPVLVATYTKALQSQVQATRDILQGTAVKDDFKMITRKGRENYLCLLNMEEQISWSGLSENAGLRSRITPLGLMARWAMETEDGDLTGGDFPGWLPDLMGWAPTKGLSDKRGECIYTACPHFRKCFAEGSIRQAPGADIVVTNHALLMTQAGGGGTTELPRHMVLDEAHHLFDSADSAYQVTLSGQSLLELRRWIAGPESRQRSGGGSGSGSRMRGLKRRLSESLAGDEEAGALIDNLARSVRALPGESWLARVQAEQPRGPGEAFLAAIGQYVTRMQSGREALYDIEAPIHPAPQEILTAAAPLNTALQRIETDGKTLHTRLNQLADETESDEAARAGHLLAAARNLNRLVVHPAMAWRAVIRDLGRVEAPEGFCDAASILRHEGQIRDMGIYRNWIDPMLPFAATLSGQADGLALTSATLFDSAYPAENHPRLGLTHFSKDGPVTHSAYESPFDYKAQARVIVLSDVDKSDTGAVAGAYQALFLASGGGGLGLFTAIRRLRSVHTRIRPALEQQNIALHAQHEDGIDAGTLIELFREDPESCLLGTDGLRDGVDVPGRSLRLVALDRVPWPRPGILHRARRKEFGGRAYDEMLVRLKLRQAFGRLIRTRSDRGVFVLLESGLPSRLHDAFPGGIEPVRMTLDLACTEIRQFLSDKAY